MPFGFEDRAVAFVDILGFSELVRKAAENAEDFKTLSKLIERLSSISSELNGEVTTEIPKEYLPKTTYISDCLIISAPVSRDNNNCWGLIVASQRILELTHTFLNLGYIFSGGLCVGKAYHDKENIVGPGYQDAYKIESENDKPRVLLSDRAKDMLQSSKHAKNDIYFTHDNHETYINGLGGNTNLVPDLFGKSRNEVFTTYRTTIESNINTLPPKESEKWKWFKSKIFEKNIY